MRRRPGFAGPRLPSAQLTDVELADSAFDLPTPELVDLLTNGDMDVEGWVHGRYLEPVD